jgi:hypothetical protein
MHWLPRMRATVWTGMLGANAHDDAAEDRVTAHPQHRRIIVG